MPDDEGRVRELGLEIPDYSVTPYYGPSYGSMKAHHQVGSTLFLSGHIPEKPDGTILHPGRLGAERHGRAGVRGGAAHRRSTASPGSGSLSGASIGSRASCGR